MALVLAPEFPDVDFAKLVKICLVHDLGEAVGGDVPAPEQARRREAGLSTGKGKDERRDLFTLLESLPSPLKAEILELWDEYEAADTAEAKLAKALDKLETILQHTQGRNPEGFDYRFNLTYGRDHTSGPPARIAQLRALLDTETERLTRGEGDGSRLTPVSGLSTRCSPGFIFVAPEVGAQRREAKQSGARLKFMLVGTLLLVSCGGDVHAIAISCRSSSQCPARVRCRSPKRCRSVTCFISQDNSGPTAPASWCRAGSGPRPGRR